MELFLINTVVYNTTVYLSKGIITDLEKDSQIVRSRSVLLFINPCSIRRECYMIPFSKAGGSKDITVIPHLDIVLIDPTVLAP